MSYPPLANGSYRVGDPPQRFPSAVPGPSASPNLAPGGVYGYALAGPAAPPAPQVGIPGGAPSGAPGGQDTVQQPGPVPVYPPAGYAPTTAPPSGFAPNAAASSGSPPNIAPPSASGTPATPVFPAGNIAPAWGAPPASLPPQPTGKRNLLIALGGAGVVALVVAAILFIVPRETGGSGGISAQGVLEIDSPVAVGGHETCYVPPSLEPAVGGDVEILSGQSAEVVARSPFVYSDGSLGHCTFTFDYSGVPEGAAPYAVRLSDFGVVDLSEQEVRDGISVVLGN
ncbi:hypothetical protein [Dietzia sp.]|uniref:hypothetical protein n=1 Tax=Dietzia sp. TaxID=1871616 RepID=UPI002FDA7DA4